MPHTRDDFRRLLLTLNAPLRDGFSPGRAQVRLGWHSAHFDRKAEWFEGFARPLWGLAPLAAGGGDYPDWELFRQGIAAGTDPAHPEYWQQPGDHDQRSVEMAALGFALALAPEELWDKLPAPARGTLATWLGSIQSVAMADNNWHFFPVLAGLGLERVGVPIDAASRLRHLERIEEFAGTDGWYGDGPRGHIDHYNGFALQFYGLIYATLAGDRDPARAARYRDRAAAFAQGFQHWFGADGAMLCMGRSRTYRFASAAFWAALAYAGVEALPWGVIRGLWARQIRWWLDQPMLDAQGRLTVGYVWPNYLMSEEYNSPGSPYWAFKAFLPLALPEDHPFWTAAELPHPAAEGPVAIPGAAMLANRVAGDVFVLPNGPTRSDLRGAVDKYNKLAYSTRFGMSVEGERWIGQGACGDNILAVSADGESWHARRSTTRRRFGGSWIESAWSPLPGVEIETLQSFVGRWEVRLHRIMTDRAISVVESGHAVPCRTASRRGAAAAPEAGGMALVLDDGQVSAIQDLGGQRGGAAMAVMPNTSLVFPQASVPVLLAELPAGTTLLGTAVQAGRNLDPSATPSAKAITAMARDANWPEPAIVPCRIAVEPRQSVR
jgi:hypothetical protein